MMLQELHAGQSCWSVCKGGGNGGWNGKWQPDLEKPFGNLKNRDMLPPVGRRKPMENFKQQGPNMSSVHGLFYF